MPVIPANYNPFAVLPDDDPADLKTPGSREQKKKKAEEEKKAATAAGSNKTKKKDRDAQDLRALAFGKPKAKGKKKRSANESASGTEQGVDAQQKEQFNKWKEEDEKRQLEAYKDDLKRATLLSLLEAEETKKQEVEKRQRKTSNHLLTIGGVHATGGDSQRTFDSCPPAPLSEDELLRRADAQAEQTLERERRLQELKLRPSPEKPLESQPEHTDGKKLSRENELSLRNTEVSILRRENEALKRERDRLRADLKESEAKEKVQLIRENDQLRTLHAEVTEEVQRLSIELEKSRTQTQDLARELRKTQVKRASSRQD